MSAVIDTRRKARAIAQVVRAARGTELAQGAGRRWRVDTRRNHLYRAAVRIGAVARQDGEVIALGRVEVDLARQQLLFLGSRAAGAVSDVAGDQGRTRINTLTRLATDRADATRGDDRHVGGVEVISQALHRQRGATDRPQ